MGTDMFLAINTSYRYTVEGFALMPIFVASPNQSGHRMAYALVSHENQESHKAALDLLKEGVEDVVNRRIREGQSSI